MVRWRSYAWVAGGVGLACFALSGWLLTGPQFTACHDRNKLRCLEDAVQLDWALVLILWVLGILVTGAALAFVWRSRSEPKPVARRPQATPGAPGTPSMGGGPALDATDPRARDARYARRDATGSSAPGSARSPPPRR